MSWTLSMPDGPRRPEPQSCAKPSTGRDDSGQHIDSKAAACDPIARAVG